MGQGEGTVFKLGGRESFRLPPPLLGEEGPPTEPAPYNRRGWSRAMGEWRRWRAGPAAGFLRWGCARQGKRRLAVSRVSLPTIV